MNTFKIAVTTTTTEEKSTSSDCLLDAVLATADGLTNGQHIDYELVRGTYSPDDKFVPSREDIVPVDRILDTTEMYVLLRLLGHDHDELSEDTQFMHHAARSAGYNPVFRGSSILWHPVAEAQSTPANVTDGEIVSYEPVYSLEEQLAKYPDHEPKIRAAAELIGKKVQLVKHADPQGDHIPLGTKGEILGFASEPFDGLVMALGGGATDLVYAEEVQEVFDMRFAHAMLSGISDIIDRQDSMITQIESVTGNAVDPDHPDFQISKAAAAFCRAVNEAARVAAETISAITNGAQPNDITGEGISVGTDPDTDPRTW